MKLTPEQEEAIDHKNGGLQLIACAGAGKTGVISQRIAKLIKEGAEPKSIVAFTFTEKAAEEMKARIRLFLEKECPEKSDFGDMYVGTIHSFCFNILKELEPKYKSYEALIDSQRVAFVSKPFNYYKKLGLPRLEKSEGISKYGVINRFLESSDIMRDENINPEKLTNKDFAESFKTYIKLLDKNKYLDFGEMVFRLVKRLENNKKILEELNKKIDHLVVDEYQDINLIQEKLIELISKGCKSVCVVGDDDQCVYQWRGSDPSYILNFEKKYLKHFKIKKISLETNFRSTEGIINLAKNFIIKNKNRLSKEMKVFEFCDRKYERGDITHKHFDSQEKEFDFICDSIKKALGSKFTDKENHHFSLSLSDFAILVRTNEDAERIIPFLEKNEIKFVLGGGENIFKRPEVKLAVECIGYVFDISQDGFSLTRDALEEKYKDVFKKESFKKADISNFINKLDKIKKQIDKIKEKGKKDYLRGGLQPFYHLIINAMGSEEFEFPEDFNYNLAMLSQAISDYESVWIRLRAAEVKYFFGFLKAYAISHYTEQSHNDPTLIEAVKILTIHKAKGLEFPVVFILGFVTKRLPRPPKVFIDESLFDYERYNGTVEDERRVYYTAFTRSQKYLFITGYKTKEGFQKEYSPHYFIEELEKKYLSDNLPEFNVEDKLPKRKIKDSFYPTSYSEINIYERCPEDFRLRHVFGYNAGVPVTFGYGTNIHNILNYIHSRYKTNPPTTEEIKKIFKIMFHMRYATEKIAENMKKAAKKIIRNYVKNHGKGFKEILETEKKFEFLLGELILLSGQIDLIKKVDEDGNVKGIEIIDFKTEKNKTYELDHKTQLRLYAIACLESLGLHPKKACVHHLDTDDKKMVDICEDSLKNTKKDMIEKVSHILEKEFPPKATSTNCNGCDYEKICSKKRYRWFNKRN